MSNLETHIKQEKFQSERVKANINILFTAHKLKTRMNAFLKNFDLTEEQFNILRILRGKHPETMCQKDILERMIAPQSNMTLLIKKLRVKSFIQVERSACDGRAYVISITPAGLEVLTRIDNRFPEEKQ